MAENRNVFDDVSASPGEFLDPAAYGKEFYEVFRGLDGVIWKLERAQTFDEGDHPSWLAMTGGDWERSLALMEEARPQIAADLPPMGELRRLRIVEWPPTPYLQWELHLLAVRASEGERCRVLPGSAVGHLEQAAELPELVILTESLAYQVVYDELGACTGARRITDPAVIGPCADAIADLYDDAEDLPAFFEREVKPLPPPLPGR
jgi:hypothetical protein